MIMKMINEIILIILMNNDIKYGEVMIILMINDDYEMMIIMV